MAQWSTFFQMQDYHDWTQKFRNLNMLIYKYLFSIPLPYQTCLHLALLFMCLSYKIMKVFLTISITFVFRFILVECWKSFSQQKKASLQSNTLTVSAMFFYARMLINCVFFFFFQCACTWLMFDAFLASLSCLSSLHSWHLGYGCLQPLCDFIPWDLLMLLGFVDRMNFIMTLFDWLF